MIRASTPTRTHGAAVARRMAENLAGQDEAIEAIRKRLQLFYAQLTPPDRPAGTFLLLGPTGTGKTRTVEVLAEALHSSPRNLLRVDCAEFQMDHEVAKLIGAPPGYLGHRETHALFNQTRINAVASEHCDLSIILFDEIEKAAPSLTRLLLGILDRAVARLGDNSAVNFDRCLIFMTSNVGASQLAAAARSRYSLAGPADVPEDRLDAIARNAAKRHFSPEFMNRLDAVISYKTLGAGDLSRIFDLELNAVRSRILWRAASAMGRANLDLVISAEAKAEIIRRGTSIEYGARELKRTIDATVVEPLADLLVDLRTREDRLCLVEVELSHGQIVLNAHDSELAAGA